MNSKRLAAISLGHFAIDILNSSVVIILTSVTTQQNMGYSKVGLGAMIYTFAASLSQPFFGLLADRLRGRWLAAVGLLWTMIFYAAASFTESYAALVAVLTVGALGSGAFHPTGIVNAGDAGGARPATATSVFFLLGQTGLSLGPFISGLVLQRMGMAGLPYIALAMTPALIFMFWALQAPMAEEDPGDAARRRGAKAAAGAGVIALFLLLVILRSTTLQSYMTLLPRYFADQGFTSGQYGLMVSIFTLAGALGTFAGGFLGDRFARHLVIAVALVSSVPFSFMLLRSSGPTYFVTASLAGALLSIPHSILLVMGQEYLPRRKGMIGGLVLGLMFASGAATAWLASWLADFVGLGAVLTALAFMPILAAGLVFFLPKPRPQVVIPEPDAAPAAAD
jgi:FSR family fosmidomycin resistance protein-like MFS transporter